LWCKEGQNRRPGAIAAAGFSCSPATDRVIVLPGSGKAVVLQLCACWECVVHVLFFIGWKYFVYKDFKLKTLDPYSLHDMDDCVFSLALQLLFGVPV
jgi:hypothetical protein